MSELGDALKLIFEKIAGFFDIFDLSFFVSGAVAMSALLFWVGHTDLYIPPIDGWMQVLAILLGCYVSGLVCFAGGRWLRIGVRWPWSSPAVDPLLTTVLRAHGLDTDQAFTPYLRRDDVRGIWRLYVRMWAELRASKELSSSLSFLNRYWVMAATYDGLGFALALWAFILGFSLTGIGVHDSVSIGVATPILIFLLLASLACFREAGRFVDYQVEELVAAIAAYRAKT